MHYERARTEKQVQDRIAEIIKTAEQIYDKSGYDAINFTAISELTKFTRPTIYKYFSTKEEILLQILLKELELWVKELIGSFRINKIYKTTDIANIWANTLSSHDKLIELYAILFTILEKNSSKDALVDFKIESLSYQQPLVELLMQLYPNASHLMIYDFLTVQLSLAMGLFPMSNLSKLQVQAIELSETGYTPPEFVSTYKNALVKLLSYME